MFLTRHKQLKETKFEKILTLQKLFNISIFLLRTHE